MSKILMTKYLVYTTMLGFFIFASDFKAEAASVYYTFKGEVNRVYDTAGYIEDLGIKIGDPVTYVMEVNEDRDALWIHEDGTKQILLDEFGIDKFYTRIVGGDYLPRQEEGTIGSPGLQAYKGCIDMIYRLAFLEYGRRDDTAVLRWHDHFSVYPSAWSIGDNYFTMQEIVYNIYGWESSMYSTLKLTSISSPPVQNPEVNFPWPLFLSVITGPHAAD